MTEPYKLYIPAGQWLVATLTSYCLANGIGNAAVAGIGSITNAWILVDSTGQPVVKNFSEEPSYEMTSLAGNVTLRQGKAQFDPAGLPTGSYPQIDTGVETYNSFAHLHVTFANPDMTISGGHLLDAGISIGAELVLSPMARQDCVPGLLYDQIPADCVADAMVTVPLGTFCNWDQRFWYPPPDALHPQSR